jgi:hypothetical protein
MNLSELQRIMARLVTEPVLRERFLDDPASAASTLGWDAEPARALATIPASRLRHYGDALVNKRCRETARSLPMTCRALGCTRFRELFRDHAAGSTTRGVRRHRDDAIAFAEGLRSHRADVTKAPSWVADLAAYEAASLRAGDPRHKIVLVRLGHWPQDLVHAALSGIAAATVPRRCTFIAWIRLRKMGPPRQFPLAIPRL